MKNLLITAAVKENLYLGNGEMANQFAKQYLSSTPTQQSMRSAEAKAFLLIVTASDFLQLLQAVQSYPGIGSGQAGNFPGGLVIVP